jgi:phosphoglycerate dehydrogenase-like enzyme
MKAVFLNDSIHIARVYDVATQAELAGLTELYPDVISGRELDEYAEVLAQAEAVFTTWGMPALTEEQIAKYLPNLKVVFYGAGSVQYFARPFLNQGVRISSAWVANGIAVAEFCSSLILLSLKGFFPAHHKARTDWHGARAIVAQHPGAYGARVGLLGMGAIGRTVAQRLRSSEIEVLGYDPFASDEVFRALGIRRAETLEEAFACDVVSNHIANLPATRLMLRYEHFSLLPPFGAFLNTGRNAQVHVPGLVRAMEEVPTRTAYFDVTDPDEPPAVDNPLLLLPNAYFTPHMAGATGQEVRRQGRFMLEEFLRYEAGEPMCYEVTAQMLETMA